MHRLLLKHDKGFRWTNSGNCMAKGALYSPDGKFYGNGHVHEYFNIAANAAALEDLLVNANGLYSVVCISGDELLLATDRVRMFPLFYARKDGQYIVSDDIHLIAAECGLQNTDTTAEAEFLASGYVSGSKTLFEGIRQVQSGELLVLGANDIRHITYYSYGTTKCYDLKYNALRDTAVAQVNAAFTRFTGSLQGRTAVLALSGGYDSRLIAAMLKQAGCNNTICFTYGRADNAESAVSEKVARKLGFTWHNIVYTDELINGYLDETEFQEYFRYSANGTSMFFMQEYFAVRELKKRGLVPADAVFVSGHSGDFLAGSQITKYHIPENAQGTELADNLFNCKFNMKKPTGEQQAVIHKNILAFINAGLNAGQLPYSVYEDWDMKEKLSKFIANSVNVYGYFGYEWRLPFWDADLTDFFRDIPYTTKINKALYDDILTNEYFKPAGIAFEKELQPTSAQLRSRSFKNAIKSFLPACLLKRLLRRNDNIFYHEITEIMRKDLDSRGISAKVYGSSYNSLIVQWYISAIRS